MSVLNSVINIVFPPLCVHCGHEGGWLCSAAQSLIEAELVIVNPLKIPGVDRVIVRGSYDCEPLAQLIQKLKYHYWTGASDALRNVIEPLQAKLPIEPKTIIIPVPLHHRRLRERGFNQSLYISRALSNVIHFPIVDLLHRTRYTKPQATLSAQERTTNIIGAFGRHKVSNWPKSVILVDDVVTTGSTIAECATVLRKNGVKQIFAVAIAKG